MRTLHHVGIPTFDPKAGEQYSEGMKLFLTDPTSCPNRVEWLRFESDSWLHPLIQNQTHLAYQVTDPQAEMAGKVVLLPPTDCGNGKWIAFVEENDIPVELIWQQKP